MKQNESRITPEPGRSVSIRRVRCYGFHLDPCEVDAAADRWQDELRTLGWKFLGIADAKDVWMCPAHAAAVRAALETEPYGAMASGGGVAPAYGG